MNKVMNVSTEGILAPYGRSEVKAVLQKNFMRGLVISVVIHVAVISTPYIVKFLGGEEDEAPMVAVKMLKYSDLGPPPSISAAPPPPSVSVAAIAKPTVGIPVPVPDAEVSPEQTIATQQELSSTPSPMIEQFDGDGGVQITQDIVIDDEPGMDEFIAVEKEPQIVRKVIPTYPDMALRAGLEGTVWVKILVDKDGTPKKVVIIKSTTEIFNDSALKAASKFLFTPAVMNNGPVRVWVAIPFKFRLKDQAPS